MYRVYRMYRLSRLSRLYRKEPNGLADVTVAASAALQPEGLLCLFLGIYTILFICFQVAYGKSPKSVS